MCRRYVQMTAVKNEPYENEVRFLLISVSPLLSIIIEQL